MSFASAYLKRLALTGGALLFCGTAVAQNMIADPIQQIEFGVICDYRPQGQDIPAPDTNAGKVRRGGQPFSFDLLTDEVPGLLGVAFGIRLLARADMGDREVRMVTRHPSFGEGFRDVETWPSDLTGGVWSARYFYFEFPYELAAGPWIMEVWLEDEMIIRQEFTVYTGIAGRKILDSCPTEGLSS